MYKNINKRYIVNNIWLYPNIWHLHQCIENSDREHEVSNMFKQWEVSSNARIVWRPFGLMGSLYRHSSPNNCHTSWLINHTPTITHRNRWHMHVLHGLPVNHGQAIAKALPNPGCPVRCSHLRHVIVILVFAVIVLLFFPHHVSPQVYDSAGRKVGAIYFPNHGILKEFEWGNQVQNGLKPRGFDKFRHTPSVDIAWYCWCVCSPPCR